MNKKMVNKFSNIKGRILYLSEYYNLSKEYFFENIGMSYGSFKGSAKERPLNSDAIENILTKYPEINAHWLITGKGEMLNEKEYSNMNTESMSSGAEILDQLKKEVEHLRKTNELLSKIIESKLLEK
ncbi:MAG: hypothetical protein ACK4JX_04440 [Flavobacterium sp.]